MRRILGIGSVIVSVLCLLGACRNEHDAELVSVRNNYKNWGWDSVYVAQNEFISLAVVPEAAGRILEYNLGEVPSLWLNPKLLGQSFAPSDEVKMKDWRNFGGYRLVPTPLNNCAINVAGEKTKRWPPPVVIGDSPYHVKIGKDKSAYQTIEVESGIQNLPVPLFDNKTKQFSVPSQVDEQLQYRRSLYIEENSSLVYIKHTLINKGQKPVKRGIMISSQHVSRSETHLEDGENFLAYVPFSPELRLSDGEQFHVTTKPEWRWRYINNNRMPLDKNNPEHVEKYFNVGTNWTGEVAPGVFEIHYDYYLMSGFHMIASKPWLCYANKLSNTVFAKLFEPYNSQLEYEDGLNIAIFNSGMETGYLETEVKTPLYSLNPGEFFNYYEMHGAAQVASLPVLDVNKTGVITKHLHINESTKEVSGEYGVFVAGQALLQVFTQNGELIKELSLDKVDPLHAFIFTQVLQPLPQNAKLKLCIKSKNGEINVLDSSF